MTTINRTELQTVPPGSVYRIAGESKVEGVVFDITKDEFLRNVPMAKLARVVDIKASRVFPIPENVEATVRVAGCLVLEQWVPESSLTP